MIRRPFKRRARSRGISATSTVLESAMVMGWFVVLLLGEKAVSNASDARRSAETAAEQSATQSSASECQAQPATVDKAHASPSVASRPPPPVQAAVAIVQALGCGKEQTFPNYTNTIKNVEVQAQSSADEVPGDVKLAGRQFEGERGLGCTEKPLDKPKGSMNEYREDLWTKNLKGY